MATTGCPACLVEAMQCNDVNWFLRLLADPQLSFNDTFSISKWEEMIEDSFGISWPFPLILRGGGPSSNHLCSHVFVPENLQANSERGAAISVIQMAMIFSVPEFNPSQMLIDSGKFDFTEPIIFHERNANDGFRLRVEDLIVLAIEVDTGHYSVRKATDFLNTRTLFSAGVWSPSAVICSMIVCRMACLGYRASGVLQLLY